MDVKEYFWVDSKIVLGYINDEDFRTFLTEVECIIPLTPNHVLTKKPNLLLPPPGRFLESDQYARKRWRRVQFLSDQFWKRWRKEYLHLLQSRTKWVARKRNMKEGDVVIISDNVFEPRSQWRLGRIENLYQSEDGLVRKVKLRMADTHLDRFGRRHFSFLERPIHNIVLLIPPKMNTKRQLLRRKNVRFLCCLSFASCTLFFDIACYNNCVLCILPSCVCNRNFRN